ncbi:MAG: hypothetical protein IJV05_07860 [Muribaculaceae bacterium]|nr:hypothetical protein [Muribaculaceae bacterium]
MNEDLQKVDNAQHGRFKRWLDAVKRWLSRLSFRTGVIVLALCVPCYIFSFAQMALPISDGAKAVLWVIFFGLAKTFQYGGLTILGVEGWKRLKGRFVKK